MSRVQGRSVLTHGLESFISRYYIVAMCIKTHRIATGNHSAIRSTLSETVSGSEFLSDSRLCETVSKERMAAGHQSTK